MADLAAALMIAQRWVGDVEGVVMVGQGEDAIDVWVTSSLVELPEQILGVPVRVRETPPIDAQ